MVAGFGHVYAVHFPDGTVEHRIVLGTPKKPGQVITLDGEPWRVARLVAHGSSVDYELHLGTLEGYPVLLLGAGENREVNGFFIYRGKLPELDQIITVEESLTSVSRSVRVIRIEGDSEFPIHATEELGVWPRARVRSFSAMTKQRQRR